MNLIVPPTLCVLMLSKATALLLQWPHKFNLSLADLYAAVTDTKILPPIRHPKPAACKIT